MTPLLQEQLEIVLRDEYRVLRELGGGGMSRVFLAEDVALGRKVVIKVLTPELAAGVNRERFQREIKLLATLQHPLLVPVLAAGEGDGLVWYSMPFVEGESLRERLQRGPVPPRKALGVVIDVAQGLAEAHRRGVVHRDVKPENILLSGGRAVVADFGIAKALSEATATQAGLTASGIAVGTPAYMAPEQAAGDPDVDARADVYALGCVAYELLSGKPPFEAPTPGQLLMAHVVQPPEPLAARAPQVGAAVSEVIMRALAKPAAERWQSASAFAEALEEVRYGGSGETRARTAAASPRATATPAGDWAQVRVVLAGLWVGAIVLAVLAVAAVHTGWAPRWTRGVAMLMAAAATVAAISGPGRLSLAGARRLVRLSAVAYGVVVALVVGEGALRAAGVGPFASLISSGRLAERDRILVAEFDNRTGDATLGELVTEALRTDLAQSRSVTVVPRSDVVAALVRMERPGATLDSALAFDLAEREGVPAVLLGTIARLGKTVVISTRLVTSSGDELAGFREVAESDDDVIAAVDRLSKAMRGKLGESLRSVASAPALETVTTGSLEALRKYTEALRISEQKATPDGFEREVALLEEAVRLDTAFAMAWRRLGVRLSSSGLNPVRGNEALTRAYRLRDRLPPVERSLAEAGYFSYVKPDRARVQAAYEAVLAADSGNRIALNNTTRTNFEDGRFVEALAGARRMLALDSTNANAWVWFAQASWALGRDADHARGVRALERLGGGDPMRVGILTLTDLAATGRWAEARAYHDSIIARIDDPQQRAALGLVVAQTEQLVGHAANTRALLARSAPALSRRDTAVARRIAHLDAQLAFYERIFLHDDTAGARAALRAWIDASGVDRWPAYERSIGNLALDYALIGDAATARARWAAYQQAARVAGSDTVRYVKPASALGLAIDGAILMAERRPLDAIARFRMVADSAEGGDVLADAFLGFAYRQAGMRDSALAVFRRWIDRRDPRRFVADQNYYVTPRALRAGCVLADDAGDVRARAFFCGRLAELWRDADAQYQPYVRDARARMAREAGTPVGR